MSVEWEVVSKEDESVRLASRSVKYNWGLGRGRYPEYDMGFISQPSLCFLRVPATKYPAVAVVSRSAVSVLNVCCRLRRQKQLLMRLGGMLIRRIARAKCLYITRKTRLGNYADLIITLEGASNPSIGFSERKARCKKESSSMPFLSVQTGIWCSQAGQGSVLKMETTSDP